MLSYVPIVKVLTFNLCSYVVCRLILPSAPICLSLYLSRRDWNPTIRVDGKKLYHGIMWPSMLLTLCTGTGLVVINGMSWVSQSAWLQIKILIVISLCIYQLYLGRLRKVFVLRANKHGHVFYRWLNEAPVIALIAIIFLAVFKPSLWVT